MAGRSGEANGIKLSSQVIESHKSSRFTVQTMLNSGQKRERDMGAESIVGGDAIRLYQVVPALACSRSQALGAWWRGSIFGALPAWNARFDMAVGWLVNMRCISHLFRCFALRRVACSTGPGRGSRVEEGGVDPPGAIDGH